MPDPDARLNGQERRDVDMLVAPCASLTRPGFVSSVRAGRRESFGVCAHTVEFSFRTSHTVGSVTGRQRHHDPGLVGG